MLGPGLPSSPLSLAIYALAFLVALLFLLRTASSRYFAVDEDDAAEPRRMSIGGGGGGDSCGNACSVCRTPTNKSCARCKSVFYCSQTCQSKHWEKHKLQCKSTVSSDKSNIVSSDSDTCRRRKSSGFGSVRLIPACGSSKVVQEPKKILFPYDEFVKLFNWDGGFEPCGLTNCGNSCFANVVLQCLSSTRPLVAYLLQRDHSSDCIRRQKDWCFLCELQAHVRRASKSYVPFSPLNILSRLPNIGGNLGYGRQEDAHEFMRFAIDTMQSVCLDEFGGEKALDPGTRETTLIHHIFDGRLQSQVKCTKCNVISNRYENMMDLTVEIQGDAESLEECLDQFTTVEWLDGENMYKCDGCNAYVKACKRLTVHQAPNILTIALKRFQTGRFGKLNKRITFPECLDLTPYMSGNGDGTDIYSLYAVVVHVDMLNASFFGHYICYTKDHYGHWYRIDDCKVTPVEVEEVLAQGAYMLLYSRKSARREPFIKPIEPARKKLIVGVDSTESKLLEATNPVGVDTLLSNVCSKPNVPLNEVPIDVSSHKDTGHERTSSIETVAAKEICVGDMDCVPSTVLYDTHMDVSEPSSFGSEDLEEDKSTLSALALEKISSVNYDWLSFVSVAEDPPTEAQDMDCHQPSLSSDAGIITEHDTRSTQTTHGTLKQPKYASSVENIGLDNVGIFSNASIITTSSVLEPDRCPDADFCTNKDAGSIVATKSLLKDSFPNLNAVGTVVEASLSAAKSSSGGSVIAPSPVLEPAIDSRTNLDQLVSTCSQPDSANGAKNDVSSLSLGTTTPAYCSENESSGKSKLPSSGGYLDGSAKEEQLAHDQVGSGCYGVDLAIKANGFINGHVEAEPDAGNNDANQKPHSANKNDSFLSSGLPSTSLGFLNNSHQPFMGKKKISVPELDQTEHSKRTASCSDPIFSRGFLDKSYRKSVDDAEIATNELEKINRHSEAIRNGSDVLDSAKQSASDISASPSLLSANGDASNGKASAFSSRGFLDRHYKKSRNEDKLAKKNLVRADKPCKTDCNGFNEVTSLPPKYGEHDFSLNKLKDNASGRSLANGDSSFK